jgi:hypothetical protein
VTVRTVPTRNAVTKTITTHLAFLSGKLPVVTVMTVVTVSCGLVLGEHLLAGAPAAIFAVLDADPTQRGCQTL